MTMTKSHELKIEIDLDDVAKEDQHIAEEFICCICQLITVDPVTCFYCNTIFCKDCIRDWAKIKKECPNRCHYKEEKLNSSLIRVLSKIRVKCKTCSKIVSYENLLGIHKLVCEGREINCLYCDTKIKMYKFKEHRDSECQYSFNICTYCQFKVIKKDYESHIQQCKAKVISCPYCSISLLKEESEKHLLECGCFKESCCICNEEYTRDSFINHSLLDCYSKKLRRIELISSEQERKLQLSLEGKDRDIVDLNNNIRVLKSELSLKTKEVKDLKLELAQIKNMKSISNNNKENAFEIEKTEKKKENISTIHSIVHDNVRITNKKIESKLISSLPINDPILSIETLLVNGVIKVFIAFRKSLFYFEHNGEDDIAESIKTHKLLFSTDDFNQIYQMVNNKNNELILITSEGLYFIDVITSEIIQHKSMSLSYSINFICNDYLFNYSLEERIFTKINLQNYLCSSEKLPQESTSDYTSVLVLEDKILLGATAFDGSAYIDEFSTGMKFKERKVLNKAKTPGATVSGLEFNQKNKLIYISFDKSFFIYSYDLMTEIKSVKLNCSVRIANICFIPEYDMLLVSLNNLIKAYSSSGIFVCNYNLSSNINGRISSCKTTYGCLLLVSSIKAGHFCMEQLNI